jgi:hypothetical protein
LAVTSWAVFSKPTATSRILLFLHALVLYRLLGIEGGEPGLVMERVLTRLEGRLLTVAWHNSAAALITGGTAGNIHVVDAVTGLQAAPL